MRCPLCGSSHLEGSTKHIRQCMECSHMFTLKGSEWAEAVAESCVCDACSRGREMPA